MNENADLASALSALLGQIVERATAPMQARIDDMADGLDLLRRGLRTVQEDVRALHEKAHNAHVSTGDLHKSIASINGRLDNIIREGSNFEQLVDTWIKNQAAEIDRAHNRIDHFNQALDRVRSEQEEVISAEANRLYDDRLHAWFSTVLSGDGSIRAASAHESLTDFVKEVVNDEMPDDLVSTKDVEDHIDQALDDLKGELETAIGNISLSIDLR